MESGTNLILARTTLSSGFVQLERRVDLLMLVRLVANGVSRTTGVSDEGGLAIGGVLTAWHGGMGELLGRLRVHGLGHLWGREGERALADGGHAVGIQLTGMLDEAATPRTARGGVVIESGRGVIVTGGVDVVEASAGTIAGGRGFRHDG